MTKVIGLELATRVQQIKPSATFAISNRARELKAEGKSIISMSIGEPDFDTPDHIKDAAIQAIRDGHTKYTAVDGIKPLKEAIVAKFAKDNSLEYGLDQILVSAGAKQSLFNALTALVNPGDEVIILAPYWVSYPDMVKLCEGVPVIVSAGIENDFKVKPKQIKSAITDRTKAIIINSPSNPTGVSYSEQELREIGQALLSFPHVTVLSDDIYEKNLWDNLPFKNIVNACPELYERAITINGVSKSYSMTGWRIGYAGGPSKLINVMKKAQAQSTSCPSSVSQYAALAALTGDQSCVSEMTNAYHERHNYLYAELQKMPGIKAIPSHGTFYTLPSIEGLLDKDPSITNDVEFSEYLLNEAGLAVIPGSASGAPGYIRICYTTSMDELKEAVKRMNQAIAKLIS